MDTLNKPEKQTGKSAARERPQKRKREVTTSYEATPEKNPRVMTQVGDINVIARGAQIEPEDEIQGDEMEDPLLFPTAASAGGPAPRGQTTNLVVRNEATSKIHVLTELTKPKIEAFIRWVDSVARGNNEPWPKWSTVIETTQLCILWYAAMAMGYLTTEELYAGSFDLLAKCGMPPWGWERLRMFLNVYIHRNEYITESSPLDVCLKAIRTCPQWVQGNNPDANFGYFGIIKNHIETILGDEYLHMDISEGEGKVLVETITHVIEGEPKAALLTDGMHAQRERDTRSISFGMRIIKQAKMNTKSTDTVQLWLAKVFKEAYTISHNFQSSAPYAIPMSQVTGASKEKPSKWKGKDKSSSGCKAAAEMKPVVVKGPKPEGAYCEGCGRMGHIRENCAFKEHPDFNKYGPWKESATAKALSKKQGPDKKPWKHLPAKWDLQGNTLDASRWKLPRGENDVISDCQQIAVRNMEVEKKRVQRATRQPLLETAGGRVIFPDGTIRASLFNYDCILNYNDEIIVGFDTLSINANYCSRRIRDRLPTSKIRMCKPIHVVLGGNNRVVVDQLVNMRITVPPIDADERNDILDIEAFVLDSCVDVIIGFGTITNNADVRKILWSDLALVSEYIECKASKTYKQSSLIRSQEPLHNARVEASYAVLNNEFYYGARRRYQLRSNTEEDNEQTPLVCLAHYAEVTDLPHSSSLNYGELVDNYEEAISLLLDRCLQWKEPNSEVSEEVALFAMQAVHGSSVEGEELSDGIHRDETYYNYTSFGDSAKANELGMSRSDYNYLCTLEEQPNGFVSTIDYDSDDESDTDSLILEFEGQESQYILTHVRSDNSKDDLDIPSVICGKASFVTTQKELCLKFRDVFSRQLRRDPANIEPMILTVDESKWNHPSNRRGPFRQGRIRDEEIKRQTGDMLKADVIEDAQDVTVSVSQVLLIPKPDKSLRFCVDFRRLNVCTTPHIYPLPNIKEMLARLGDQHPKYFAVLDLTKGYYQAPLHVESRKYTTFTTPFGMYQWKRVPMGLAGAPSFFQGQMAKLLTGILHKGVEIYLDDIIIYGQTEHEYLQRLQAVLERFRSKKITVNPDKCRLGLDRVEYVGHVISEQGLDFSEEKIREVVDFKQPSTQGEMKTFIGLAGYFRDHIKNFSIIAGPLERLVESNKTYQKGKAIIWNPEAQQAFKELKEAVNKCPTLFFFDDTLPVHLYTDASLIGFGGYLCQKNDTKELPIGFMSRRFTPKQMEWDVPERECWGIIAAVRKFKYLLRDIVFTLHTDHRNLVYIKEQGNAKVIRWKNELNEYQFILEHVAGKDNQIADALSRNAQAPYDEELKNDPSLLCYLLARVDIIEPKPEPMFYAITPIKKFECTRVPDNVYTEIQKVHNAYAGHHGVERTLKMIRKNGFNEKYLREYVRLFIKQCDVCQKFSERPVAITAQKYTTVGKLKPFDCINIDTIGPFPADKYGRTYCVVIVDTFSRYTSLYPVPDNSAKSAAEALILHNATFGVTRTILHDGGAEYENQLMDTYCRLTGAIHNVTVAHSHEENSIVERANKEVKRWLTQLIYDSKKRKEEWSELLPFAQRIHNSTIIDSFGYTPNDIVFGSVVTNDQKLLLNNIDPKAKLESWNEYILKLIRQQNQVIEKVREIAIEHDRQHTVTNNDNKNTIYSVNSYVLLAWPTTRMDPYGRPSRLDVLYRGPYKVISHDQDTYIIMDIITNKLLPPRHVSMLRPYNYDSTRTDPVVIANKDHPEYYLVEKIVDYKGNFDQKKSLRFEVKWIGYDETTWEPYSVVSKTEAFVKFLNENQLHKHLPVNLVDNIPNT